MPDGYSHSNTPPEADSSDDKIQKKQTNKRTVGNQLTTSLISDGEVNLALPSPPTPLQSLLRSRSRRPSPPTPLQSLLWSHRQPDLHRRLHYRASCGPTVSQIFTADSITEPPAGSQEQTFTADSITEPPAVPISSPRLLLERRLIQL